MSAFKSLKSLATTTFVAVAAALLANTSAAQDNSNNDNLLVDSVCIKELSAVGPVYDIADPKTKH